VRFTTFDHNTPAFRRVALSLRAATRRLNAPADYTKPLDDVLALAQRTTGRLGSASAGVNRRLLHTVKHASARRASVALQYERPVVRSIVRDDGRGFNIDPSYRSYAGHWGLLGMRERVEQAHGTLRVVSVEGKGPEVSLAVPYR
jgi:hypothetical protein